ncbi:hypothetical protein HRI_005019000 [Hibiscus trionum]|uniref:Reverse transcriptase n=1 Tax=Hibiscus trionum TaxID=183268 RepID=A0A9W7JIP5_HIBTR|nr:hypothetical protein HRI_005019000 [Hibiscus trionum]
MGFADSWLSLMERCMSSVSYSVVINDMVGSPFCPSRGLRQWDPLSPYLFLFCTEGLSSLLRQALNTGDLSGFRLNRYAPTVSHLLFADDCLVFGKASVNSAVHLKNILNMYAENSGQVVNFDKSGLFFSTNVSDETRSRVVQIFGVSQTSSVEKYLGLPSVIGRNKRQAFIGLGERMSSKINNWAIRPLSQGGKEVFIKAVLQAIPVYTMSVFLLPKTLCRRLESILAKYWWQKGHNRQGIHWCTWADLCYLKEDGGLGFRDMQKFNISLMCKQGWRMIVRPSSLVSRIYRAKYFPGLSFLTSRLGSHPSYIWRSIWSARGLLESGLRWQVGSGLGINIWNDYWLPATPPTLITTPRIDSLHTVADLTIPGAGMWNEDLIRSTFSNAEAEQILSIPLTRFPKADCRVWSVEPSGMFTVRSGYKLLLNSNGTTANDRKLFNTIWSVPCPSRIKFQTWKFIRNFVPTRANLCFRRILNDNSCPRCNIFPEDSLHIIRDCQFSLPIWSSLGFTWNTQINSLELREWLSWLFANYPSSRYVEILVTIWSIWWARNKLVNENTLQRWQSTTRHIQGFVRELKELPVRLQSGTSLCSRWQPPPSSFVKTNFDAAFNPNTKISWSGCVIRNNEGFVLGSSRRKSYRVHSAFAGEAIALVHAISFAIDLGFSEVVFEGDCLAVLKKMRSQEMDFSVISSIIWEAHQLASRLHACRFQFVRRGGNTVAHALASNSSLGDDDGYWIEEVPPLVERLVEADRRDAV